MGLSANKVMDTVFWDARGVIHIDYLQKRRTINGDYYTNLLDRFNEDLKKKRPHLAKKKVLFHQDNARVHTCVVSIRRILRIQPRVTISCFRTLRNGLAERDFTYFEDLEKSYFLEGIQKLEKRWTKCIELKGDY